MSSAQLCSGSRHVGLRQEAMQQVTTTHSKRERTTSSCGRPATIPTRCATGSLPTTERDTHHISIRVCSPNSSILAVATTWTRVQESSPSNLKRA